VRVLVRLVVGMACGCFVPPLLENLRAHDDEAVSRGVPKAVGNDRADFWAKRAAGGAESETWTATAKRYGDAVELLEVDNFPILSVATTFALAAGVGVGGTPLAPAGGRLPPGYGVRLGGVDGGFSAGGGH